MCIISNRNLPHSTQLQTYGFTLTLLWIQGSEFGKMNVHVQNLRTWSGMHKLWNAFQIFFSPLPVEVMLETKILLVTAWKREHCIASTIPYNNIIIELSFCCMSLCLPVALYRPGAILRSKIWFRLVSFLFHKLCFVCMSIRPLLSKEYPASHQRIII